MRAIEFLRESMSDIAIELEDYNKMSPAEFQNAYHMTKQQWYQKYQDVIGKVDQHHLHKAHSYAFHIPGEDPQLNQDITRHFDSEQEAQKFYNQLRRKNYGVTMHKIN
jgi:hypothetical protein